MVKTNTAQKGLPKSKNACDKCKDRRTRCEFKPDQTKCDKCIEGNHDCRFENKPKKRGPKPKPRIDCNPTKTILHHFDNTGSSGRSRDDSTSCTTTTPEIRFDSETKVPFPLESRFLDHYPLASSAQDMLKFDQLVKSMHHKFTASGIQVNLYTHFELHALNAFPLQVWLYLFRSTCEFDQSLISDQLLERLFQNLKVHFENELFGNVDPKAAYQNVSSNAEINEYLLLFRGIYAYVMFVMDTPKLYQITAALDGLYGLLAATEAAKPKSKQQTETDALDRRPGLLLLGDEPFQMWVEYYMSGACPDFTGCPKIDIESYECNGGLLFDLPVLTSEDTNSASSSNYSPSILELDSSLSGYSNFPKVDNLAYNAKGYFDLPKAHVVKSNVFSDEVSHPLHRVI